MAVTDNNAIRFTNTRIRPLADKLVQTYWLSKEINAEITALGLASIIPNDATSITDGSATDGRPPIVGSDVYNVSNLAATIITTFEATSNQKLNQILRVAVNITP